MRKTLVALMAGAALAGCSQQKEGDREIGSRLREVEAACPTSNVNDDIKLKCARASLTVAQNFARDRLPQELFNAACAPTDVDQALPQMEKARFMALDSFKCLAAVRAVSLGKLERHDDGMSVTAATINVQSLTAKTFLANGPQ